jgi:hypothetical protein
VTAAEGQISLYFQQLYILRCLFIIRFYQIQKELGQRDEPEILHGTETDCAKITALVYKDPTGHESVFDLFWKGSEHEAMSEVFKGSSSSGDNKPQPLSLKEQLAKNIQPLDPEDDENTGRTSWVEHKGKRINFVFQDGFSNSMKGKASPDRVIKNLKANVLETVVNAAAQSDITSIEVSGLERPKKTLFSKPTSLHVKSSAIDIVSVTDSKGKTHSFAGTVDQKGTDFIDALLDNSSQKRKKLEIYDPDDLYKERNGKIVFDKPNTGKGNLGKTHKGHLHYGLEE